MSVIVDGMDKCRYLPLSHWKQLWKQLRKAKGYFKDGNVITMQQYRHCHVQLMLLYLFL
jgi:hypothetical protein